MTRKRLLLWTTVLLMLTGIGFALVPFGRALSPNAQARTNSTYMVRIAPLVAGELQRFTVNGRPLFVLKPSAEQWQSIRQLDSFVWDQHRPAWNSELGAFVYWGYGTRWGFELQLWPAPHSTLVDIYVADAQWFPPGVKPVWLGGYWNDHDEVSYDYAGRVIRDFAHTYNGFNAPVSNLEPARVKLIEPDKLAVYFFPDPSKND